MRIPWNDDPGLIMALVDFGLAGIICPCVGSPEECERIVKETAGKKGIIGFAIPSTRHSAVHHNKYMKLYRMIEETGWICGETPAGN